MSNIQQKIVNNFLTSLAEVDGIKQELVDKISEALEPTGSLPTADELATLITDATRGDA